MPFKPATDWVEAFPEEPEGPPINLPPARKRTRTAPSPPAFTDESPDSARPDVRSQSQLEAPATEGGTTQAPDPDTGDDLGYTVGYKKPPRHSQFKPGRSGNPKGRPRKAKSLNTIVRETLGGKVAVRTAKGTKKISRIEAVLQKTLEQAMKGNPRAQTELIKLWRSAVPDEAIGETAHGEEDLTAADIAMLEAFGAQLRQPEGGAP